MFVYIHTRSQNTIEYRHVHIHTYILTNTSSAMYVHLQANFVVFAIVVILFYRHASRCTQTNMQAQKKQSGKHTGILRNMCMYTRTDYIDDMDKNKS